MTDRHHHWPGLRRLADPLAGRELPSADDPSAHALLEAIMDKPATVGTEAGNTLDSGRSELETPAARTRRRGRYALLAAVAAVAVLAFGAVLVVDGNSAADATPLFAAIDQTAALDSGQLEITDSRTLDGTTVTDRQTVRFRGDDEDIVIRSDPSKALAEVELGPEGFVPDLLEVRTVSGQTYMRVTSEETDDAWMPSTWAGSLPYVAFAERLRRVVDGADGLTVCGDDGGVTAYCLSTTSNADVQQFVEHIEFTGSADIRIEIDDATGLLSTFEFRATDADLRNATQHFDLPTYDAIESRWQFQTIDPDWRPEVPELG